jgi:transposase, IS30 family
MPRYYSQLTYANRCQIHAFKATKMSNRAIAAQLGVHPRTIDREVKRNQGGCGYRHKQAQAFAEGRRFAQKGKPVKMTPTLVARIEDKLTNEQWSPEQISGRLKIEANNPIHISHETIYQHIYADKREKGKLYLNLRRKSRKYQRRINGKTTRGQIIGRVDIEKRPKIIEKRERLGDWEADTIVGLGHQSSIVTLVDRTSRLTLILKLLKNGAEEVAKAIKNALKTLAVPVHSITFDNGKEFAMHLEIAKYLNTETYFAKPYHSWERGTNENTNGLIRQYFPKKTDFNTVSKEQLDKVQNLLNNRPRKTLKYLTPAEVNLRMA